MFKLIITLIIISFTFCDANSFPGNCSYCESHILNPVSDCQSPVTFSFSDSFQDDTLYDIIDFVFTLNTYNSTKALFITEFKSQIVSFSIWEPPKLA
jgi:hypothetical protein